jgi:hypothetical protein
MMMLLLMMMMMLLFVRSTSLLSGANVLSRNKLAVTPLHAAGVTCDVFLFNVIRVISR